ncbi:MAG: ionic transporter y4hA [Marmoricola sp.]
MNRLPTLTKPTSAIPLLAAVFLAATWGRQISGLVVALVALVLIAVVVCAVHHAEVVAHRIGEPFGAIVLALAVTVIEVGLIVSLMLADSGNTSALARDTVFAAVMISTNGIVGLSLFLATAKHGLSVFNADGAGGGLAATITLAAMTLVLPRFTLTDTSPAFTSSQLIFAGVASVLLFGLYISTQTVRHRNFFLPLNPQGELCDEAEQGEPPTRQETQMSLGLLLVALVCVVGLAKVTAPTLEGLVVGAGIPVSFVGVVIALVVLGPETLAAARAALRGRVQTSLNLAYGSAVASIGLTIPVLAVVTAFTKQELHLGLGGTHLVLLAVTAVVGTLTVVPGRATRLQGGLHLALLASYLMLSIVP